MFNWYHGYFLTQGGVNEVAELFLTNLCFISKIRLSLVRASPCMRLFGRFY